MDVFWSDPIVVTSLPSPFLLVRLSQSTDAEELSQFSELYALPAIPCVLYFAPNSDSVSHAWSPPPSADALSAFFFARLEMPRLAHRPASRRRNAKLSLAVGDARLVKEFAPNATLADVREWIRAHAGDPARIAVAHTNAPLPSDDSMTVTEADLVPSALLRVDIQADNILPVVPHVSQPDERDVNVKKKRKKRLVMMLLDIVNPWPDVVEVEDFFAVKD
jgi:hypothetical protein